LRVHERTIEDSGHQVHVAREVDCPRRGRRVPVADCSACGLSCGLLRHAGDAFVMCSVHAPEPDERGDAHPIATIMSRDPVCVTAGLSVVELVELFVRRGLSAVPVVDREGLLIGLVSQGNLLGQGEARVVADVMTRWPFSLTETAPIERAAALMAYEGIHRVPIISEQGKVVGILSAVDVMRWLARHGGFVVSKPPSAAS
jgi:CBS domain-containing protein